MGEKKKRTKQLGRGANGVIARVNAFPVPREEMLQFAEAAGRLEPGERDFEGHAHTAIQLFSPDRDKYVSAMFRMEALDRFLSEEAVPGWTKPVNIEGAVLTHPAFFAAAGVVPLVEKAGDLAFDRDEFLRMAFEIAKELRRE
jgi:hypothetical protein